MGCCNTNSCIHIVYNTKKRVSVITLSHYLAHTQPIFMHLSILPLDKLILNQFGIIMNKHSSDLISNVMDTLYNMNKDVHSHHTRWKYLLRISKGTIRFCNLSARVWSLIVKTVNVNVYI